MRDLIATLLLLLLLILLVLFSVATGKKIKCGSVTCYTSHQACDYTNYVCIDCIKKCKTDRDHCDKVCPEYVKQRAGTIPSTTPSTTPSRTPSITPSTTSSVYTTSHSDQKKLELIIRFLWILLRICLLGLLLVTVLLCLWWKRRRFPQKSADNRSTGAINVETTLAIENEENGTDQVRDTYSVRSRI